MPSKSFLKRPVLTVMKSSAPSTFPPCRALQGNLLKDKRMQSRPVAERYHSVYGAYLGDRSSLAGVLQRRYSPSTGLGNAPIDSCSWLFRENLRPCPASDRFAAVIQDQMGVKILVEQYSGDIRAALACTCGRVCMRASLKTMPHPDQCIAFGMTPRPDNADCRGTNLSIVLGVGFQELTTPYPPCRKDGGLISSAKGVHG